MNAPQRVDVDNPWRTFIENCIGGSNYFRGSEYRKLLSDLDRLYAAESKLAERDAEIAANDKETDRLHSLINAGNRRITELEAAYLHYRPLAERAEAAERAREEACGLLTRHISGDVDADTTLYGETAAFLAANGASHG